MVEGYVDTCKNFTFQMILNKKCELYENEK